MVLELRIAFGLAPVTQYILSTICGLFRRSFTGNAECRQSGVDVLAPG